MQSLVFTFVFSVLFLTGIAQTAPEPVTADSTTSGKTDPIEINEEYPSFPGGEQAFAEYLRSHLQYPAAEEKAGKQGTVYVEFVVEKDGSITNVRVIKEVPDAPGLSKEALRVISGMPKWNPGKMYGKPVRVIMREPVKFILTD